MAKDMIVKAIETMLSGTPVGIAQQAPKKLKNLIEKYKKEKGKPKGRSPSMVLGSASKAGMQGKQGPSIKRKPFQREPNPGIPGRPPRKPLQNFLRPGTKPKAVKKTNGKEGSMVESFRKNKKKGRRAI